MSQVACNATSLADLIVLVGHTPRSLRRLSLGVRSSKSRNASGPALGVRALARAANNSPCFASPASTFALRSGAAWSTLWPLGGRS